MKSTILKAAALIAFISGLQGCASLSNEEHWAFGEGEQEGRYMYGVVRVKGNPGGVSVACNKGEVFTQTYKDVICPNASNLENLRIAHGFVYKNWLETWEVAPNGEYKVGDIVMIDTQLPHGIRVVGKAPESEECHWTGLSIAGASSKARAFLMGPVELAMQNIEDRGGLECKSWNYKDAYTNIKARVEREKQAKANSQ